MGHKWSEAIADSIAGKDVQQIIHLSDGTLVYLKRTSAPALELRYTSDHITTNLIATLTMGATSATFSNNGSAGYGLCRDNLDNIYVVGTTGAVSTSRRIQAFTKGAGYTWTPQAAASVAGTGSLAANERCFATWCNTGGGTSNKGHILMVATGQSHTVFDAGAALAGTGTITSSAATPTFTTGMIKNTIYLASDGFGGTSGIAVGNNSGTADAVGGWTVGSAGTLTTNVSITTTLAGMGGNATPFPIRVAANVFALVALKTATAGAGVLAIARCSTGAILTTATTKNLADNAVFNTSGNQIAFGVAMDLQNANKVYVLYHDQTTGTTIRQIGAACASGVVWDANSSVHDTAVGAAASDFAHGLLQEPQSNAFQDVLWVNTGSATVYDDVVAFNAPPTAPTLTAPTNGSVQDLAAGYTFAWTFNDPNVGDTQSAYAFRRKISGAGAYEYWNAGTGAWQSTEVYNANVAGSLTFAASKWTNGNVYQWSVSTKDAGGLAGPYATDFTVSASTAASLSVTAPTGTVTTSSRPTVTWSESDPEGDAQQTYQVKVESGAYGTSPGAGTAVWDSTEVADVGARARDVGTDLANGTTYRFFVMVKTNGQYSAWAYSTATIMLDAPAVPTFVAAADQANARVSIAIQGRDNMLSANQASLETDTTGWAVVAGSFAALTRTTAQSLNGAASAQMAKNTSTSDMGIQTPTGLGGIPVLPNKTYTAVASFKANTTGRNVKVGIAWYDAAGATIGVINYGGVVADTNAGWTQATYSGASPANAAYAAVFIFVLAVPVGEVHYIDAISLAVGTSTVWTRGGLDGTTLAVIEYRDGVEWLPLRGSPYAMGAGQMATAYDYESPPNEQRDYRVKVEANI